MMTTEQIKLAQRIALANVELELSSVIGRTETADLLERVWKRLDI